MNEELQGTLNEALLSLISTATTAKDFIVAELPDVVNQLLMWKMTVSLIQFVVGIVAMLTIPVWIAFSRGWRNRLPASHSYDFDRCDYWAMTGITSIIVFLGGIFVADITWLQILIAPKLYLIEYAASLVK